MSTWFTSTLQTVRERSLDALEFVRKDLTEFTTTVKTDTESYLNKLASESTNESVQSKENSSQKFTHPSTPVDRLQNEKHRFQNDESTYLTDPSAKDAYETWQSTHEFTDDHHKGEIAQLLIDAPQIRAHYARLVPTCTSHNQFWSRYFFRLSQLEQSEHRRLQLLKRAHEICNENEHQRTKSTDWDDMDESDTISGDSWEKEFDENETTTNALSSSMTSTTTKVPSNDLNEDEWESWT